jgi:hypothetical protein
VKFILLLAIGLTFWSCKSSNDDFDPFDKDFSFHNKINIADYDSIFDDIEYWTLQNRYSGLNTFYILYRPPYFFMNDKIVGKGFSLVIDSIATTDCGSEFYGKDDPDNILKKLCSQNPIDFEEVKARLLGLGITDIKILSDTIVPFKLEITNFDRKTFNAKLETECNFQGHVIRHIDFINVKEDLPGK